MTKVQIFVCRNCKAEWSRNAVRGQVPKWCPDCRTLFTEKRCVRCCEVKAITKSSKHCRDCWSDVGPARRSKEIAVFNGPAKSENRIIHVRTAHRLTSGRCRVCSGWFVSHHTDVTCSPECLATSRREQRSFAKDRRRARKRDAFVENVSRRKVFEADGYRCHLCGKKVDKTKVAPHPKSPTIDHVIPLAKGGTHEPKNCRTAHFLCNSTKRDGGGGEQLLLIA